VPDTSFNSNKDSRRAQRVTLATAIILAIAALMSSYAGYQSTLWNGVQATHYTRASALRVASTQAGLRAGQVQAIDAAIFLSWLEATSREETKLAAFYRARFRPELSAAFEKWRALTRSRAAAAPATPFVLPDYHLAINDRANALEAQAKKEFDLGQAANDLSDSFALATVIFAHALFFGGVSQVPTSLPWYRRGTFLMSLIACSIGCWRVATLSFA
jgi:hypothetical protein